MPRRLYRLSLALVLLLSGEAWALGLGEVRLDSALNEPLIARVELLSATAEELESLKISMASAETFARYGIDRPLFLQGIRFDIVPGGGGVPAYVQLRSSAPITEPFLTFLIEASWSSGRLLREYTVLLDPPTYAPPTAQRPAVVAPQRSAAADSGQIDRTPAPAPRPAPTARTTPVAEPPATGQQTPVADDRQPVQAQAAPPQRSGAGSDGYYTVARGETLWGIATAVRPDSGLTMNQTMLALYEANPEAFGGNINNLRQGARLRLPSADQIYQIDRGTALAEVQRQHDAWGSGDRSMASGSADTGVDSSEPAPSLLLVPPDEELVGIGTGEDADDVSEPVSREQQILDEIAEIEAVDVPTQPSLISLRNNELAALRQELAEIRGEPYEPPADMVDDDPFVAEDDSATDETTSLEGEGLDTAGAEAEPLDSGIGTDSSETTPDRSTTTIASPPPEPSLVEQILGYVTSTIGMLIGGVLLLVIGILSWFMLRGRGDSDDDSWNARLDADSQDLGGDVPDLSGTENLRAPMRDDESFVVVEQPAGEGIDDTIEASGSYVSPPAETVEIGAMQEPETPSIEDTYSSETAVNLDESDPIAEADFHMAYGLYDQAADLINGALEVEPERTDLLTKLCETYFVWGNRDAFIDAAERLQAAVGEGESAEWDKIVIMGQQIASDHTLFAGAGVAGATRAVDLTFDSGSDDDGGALDMEFDGDDGAASSTDFDGGSADDGGVDFFFDDEDDEDDAATIESPTDIGDTVEHDFGVAGGTAELPVMSEDRPESRSAPSTDATAEIDLDDLGLDLSGLGEEDATQVASLDDDDDNDITGTFAGLGATEVAPLDDDEFSVTSADDDLAATGKNPQLDPAELDDPAVTQSEIDVRIDDEELEPTSEMRLAADETGQRPSMNPADDESLLDATGATQVLGEDFDIQTIVGDDDDEPGVGDDDATMLASDLDSEDEYDFAKTEALPADSFALDSDLDATGELPAVASTDMDLDLDNLTAALQVSELGDTMELPVDEPTVEQPRDDKTVEQPGPSFEDDDTSLTQALSPDDVDGDLHEARTMTEVGTKLDLARAYVDMGDPSGARSILEEVLEEGDEGQRQQAKQLLDSLPT